MSKESEWIPYFESGKDIHWVANPRIQTATRNATEKLLRTNKYVNDIHKIGITYQIGVVKEIAESGNTIIRLSIKTKKETEKDKVYRFAIGLHPGWKISQHQYETDKDTITRSIHGVRIKYIQKTDKNHGGARFAVRDRNITGFGYFGYLGLDLSHEEIMNEVKHALIYLSESENI